MKYIKYTLLLGCALGALPVSAAYNINGDKYKWDSIEQKYVLKGTTTAYVSQNYDIINGIESYTLKEGTLALTGKKQSDSDTYLLTFNNNAQIMPGENVTISIGQESNTTPTIVNFSDNANWNLNQANMNFSGKVFAKVNGAQTLFKTTGNVTGEELNVLVANGTGNTELKIRAQNSANNLINGNALYNVSFKESDPLDTLTSTYAVTQKSAAEMTGYTSKQAGLLLTMMNTAEGSNKTYDNLTELAQLGGYETSVKAALNQMLPITEATNTASMEVAKQNANLAMARMAGIAGGEEAETSITLIPWIQGMFNHTNNNQSEGFTANTKGIAMGIDAEINNAWTVGIGYSNVNSRIKTDTSSTRGYGDNGFIYGQYKPADWYVRAMTGFGRTTYKDKTNGTKWDVDAYTLNAFAGYIWGILDTSIGARYTYLDNKSYKSGNATISADDTDNLTGVVDFKVSQEYAAKDWMITPSAHVGFTYDVISADNASTVALGAGYGSYEVNGERLHKAGVEIGTGVVFKNGNSEFHLNYEGAFRKDNYSNGGFVKFKYNF